MIDINLEVIFKKAMLQSPKMMMVWYKEDDDDDDDDDYRTRVRSLGMLVSNSLPP